MTLTKQPQQTALHPHLVELGLEPYVLALEVDGLAVVPPEIHGVPPVVFDRLTELLLAYASDVTGTTFTLDAGPADELEFAGGATSALHDRSGPCTQFLLGNLASHHRLFRDLAVNPVGVALVRYLIGGWATRLSSNTCFVKWHGDYGYGPGHGMHCDQQETPRPWGLQARTANTNWLLTDYTQEGGALCYVPGSHRLDMPPDLGAVNAAVPVEAPRGSLIVFHGATWHGGFPRVIPGMRLMVDNYYRHLMVTSQEEFCNSFPLELIDDCVDPTEFRQLLGIDDTYPYVEIADPIPTVRHHQGESPQVL
jgi:hypothetical protein